MWENQRLIDLGTQGTLIGGIRVIQHLDFTFSWHMKEYIDTMKIINVPKGFISQTKELDEAHMSEVVSSNGKIGWVGGNGRPDLVAGHSTIAGQYKDNSTSLITQCNSCVKQAKEHNVVMKVWSIPPQILRLVCFCDSSFDFSGVRHQQGWIIGFTNTSLNLNERAPVTIVAWKSRKLARKAGSPQLVETYAASHACAETNWVKCILYSVMYSDYDIMTQRQKAFCAFDSTAYRIKD